MTFGAAFINELVKLADGYRPEDVHRVADRLGVKWDNDPEFMALCKKLTGKAHLDNMESAELHQVAQAIIAKHGKRKLPQLPRIPRSKQVKSDLVRAADRKKMLLGVKREKAILKMDIMKRIAKKQRLALRPFKSLKKEQRQMRLGLVRSNRKQARRGYGR